MCGREEATAASCTTATILFPGETMHDAISYGEESYEIAGDRCPDCGVAEGGFHHPFCMLEQCPRCPGRLLRCPCLDSDHTQ